MRRIMICGLLAASACTPDAASPASVAVVSQGLSETDQCSEQEVAYWDGRMQACTGPWYYKTYDCFKEDRTSACEIEGYEQKPIMGTLSCEHPDNGTVRWTRAMTLTKTITYLQLAGYEAQLMKEARENFGPDAIGVYAIKSGEIDQLPKWLSKLANNDRPVQYTEVYYHEVEPNQWAQQASYNFTMPVRDTMTKQHDIMNNAKANLHGGFGVGTWPADAKPGLTYTPNVSSLFAVEETFYKPSRFAVKPHPSCGTGVVGYEQNLATPKYKLCRHASHGREDSNVCGAAEQQQTSGTNLARGELPAQHAYAHRQAVCSTGDALAQGNASQRLQAMYEVVKGRNGDTREALPDFLRASHFKVLVFKRAKFLAERSTDAWTNAEHETIRELYERSVGVHACGTGGSSQLALVDQCHRMGLEHVSAATARNHLAECLADTPLPTSLRSTDAAFHRGRLAEVSHTILEKFIRKARAEALPICENGADAASKMIESWYDAALPHADRSWVSAQRDNLVRKLAEQCLEESP